MDGKKKKKTHENYHVFGKQAFILITKPLLKIFCRLSSNNREVQNKNVILNKSKQSLGEKRGRKGT
jgi:hypothetical protein